MAKKRKRSVAASPAVNVTAAEVAVAPLGTSSNTSTSNRLALEHCTDDAETQPRKVVELPAGSTLHNRNSQEGTEVDCAAAIEVSVQLEEDEDEGVVPEIPWALRRLSPEPEHTQASSIAGAWATSYDDDDDDDDDKDGEQERQREGAVDDSGVVEGAPPNAASGAGADRWKMHLDRRKHGSQEACAGAGGRGADVGKGSRRSRRSSGIKSERAGGTTERGNGNGHYGPRMNTTPPLSKTLVPKEHKIRRLGQSAALVVGMDAGEQLPFVGAARVRCGHGGIDLSGFVLLPVPFGPYVEAHSPRWMSLLVIRALSAEECSHVEASSRGAVRGVNGESAIEDDEVLEGEVEEVIDEMAAGFAVVLVLRPLRDGPLNFLSAQGDADSLYAADSSAHTVKKSRTRFDVDPRKDLHLPGMQAVLKESAGLHPLTVPQDWADVLHAVIRAPSSGSDLARKCGSVLVCGAKGVGKSTFCRLLVNRMLGRHAGVRYMDCDLGQPEFTTPGVVSLHRLDAPVLGPPHSNIRRPELAYFIGTTTSKPEPLLYSAAVRALAEHAAVADQDTASLACGRPPVPLVVNTDGWVKGMGEDLLGAVVDAIQPQHVIMILGDSVAKQFSLDRLPQGCEVHRVAAYSGRTDFPTGRIAPALPSTQDLRTLRLVSYFVGQQEDGHPGGNTTNGISLDSHKRSGGVEEEEKGVALGNSSSKYWTGGATVRGGALYDQQREVVALLSRRKPRQVPWKAVQIRAMNGPVPPNLILHAINGALVGLVESYGPLNGGTGPGSNGSAAGEGLTCLAETPLAPCIGLGIVRSVDVENRVLYVLTPEPLDVLRRVKVLIKGSLQLPMELLYDPNWCSHPYFSAETVGGEVIKSRNYLLRRN